MVFLASTVTACARSRCIFSKRGLSERYLNFVTGTFSVVPYSIPVCSWDQSIRRSVCLTGVHVAPLPGVCTGRTHGELQGTFFLFRFHHVAVSSQHCKEPNGTCQRQSKKCTLKRNQWLTHFSRRIGELHLHHRWVHLSAGQQTHTLD